MKSIFRKTSLAVALSAALGVSTSLHADTITMSWSGAFTMLNAGGQVTNNSDTSPCYPGMVVVIGQFEACSRTAITGTLTYDSVSGGGSGTIAPFSFFGSGDMVYTSFNLQAIGNGAGGAGSLVLGNLNWNWNWNNGIPVSIVWDASGLQSAVADGVSAGQSITGGALAASDNTTGTLPIGPAVMATTTWNTTLVGAACTSGNCIGRNPSGTLPLITDTIVDTSNGDIGIGGNPMIEAPLKGYNANIDILSATVTSIVPVPGAVWLFGSGLAGLVSLARRRR